MSCLIVSHAMFKNSWHIPSLPGVLCTFPFLTARCSFSKVIDRSRESFSSAGSVFVPILATCWTLPASTTMSSYLLLIKVVKIRSMSIVDVCWCPLLSCTLCIILDSWRLRRLSIWYRVGSSPVSLSCSLLSKNTRCCRVLYSRTIRALICFKCYGRRVVWMRVVQNVYGCVVKIFRG